MPGSAYKLAALQRNKSMDLKNIKKGTAMKKKKPTKLKGGPTKAKGGLTKLKVGKKKQGYAAREDESLGMRRGKASTKKQGMRARRDESYGKWGKRKGGKVNK